MDANNNVTVMLTEFVAQKEEKKKEKKKNATPFIMRSVSKFCEQLNGDVWW